MLLILLFLEEDGGYFSYCLYSDFNCKLASDLIVHCVD